MSCGLSPGDPVGWGLRGRSGGVNGVVIALGVLRAPIMLQPLSVSYPLKRTVVSAGQLSTESLDFRKLQEGKGGRPDEETQLLRRGGEQNGSVLGT